MSNYFISRISPSQCIIPPKFAKLREKSKLKISDFLILLQSNIRMNLATQAKMAYKATSILKNEMGNFVQRLSCRRWSHFGISAPAPLSNAISRSIETSFVLPEFDQELGSQSRVEVPSFSFDGGMELMAVPKKKISKHKRGIRNGPKALKPIPVIVRCTCCGRVKLPHFYCCSGKRGTEGERADSTN